MGGAGYIGSVTVAELLTAGHQVIVYDNLSTGHRQAVAPAAELVVGDTRDEAALDQLFARYDIGAVVYYGGLIAAGESMQAPGRYFAHNVGGVITLLNAMVAHGVRRFVFSSSAAVYGEPDAVPIPEEAPMPPINPYGESKAAVERLLRWYDSQCDLRYVSLRYFNAAGAADASTSSSFDKLRMSGAPSASLRAGLGEDHRPETHLIPIVLQVALGQRPYLPLYGSDYPTPDGTCLRDYIHVADLARAHLLALEQCDRGSAVYNLGNGRGFSNRQVIEAARRVTGHPIPVREEQRRPGDPAALVASAQRAQRELGWRPQVSDLEAIVASAWRWHKTYPKGYGE